MSKQSLQKQLNELHDELASAADLDPQLRRQLREVADEIEARLGDRAQTEEDLQARVRQATVDFEAEHPRLAHILGDLADTLTKLGI